MVTLSTYSLPIIVVCPTYCIVIYRYSCIYKSFSFVLDSLSIQQTEMLQKYSFKLYSTLATYTAADISYNVMYMHVHVYIHMYMYIFAYMHGCAYVTN